MPEPIEAFPLHWPPMLNRTKDHMRRAPFHRKSEQQNDWGKFVRNDRLTIADSRDRLMRELQLLGGRDVVISSNLRLRMDGLPVSNQAEPDDPGIAVYFKIEKSPHCMACDRWDRAADNLAAIAKYVEAMRGQIRWGVGDIATMFAGFKALPGAIVTPPPMTESDALNFLAKMASIPWQPNWSNADIDAAYRAAARKLHPDANGGQEMQDWHTLQKAKEVLEAKS